MSCDETTAINDYVKAIGALTISVVGCDDKNRPVNTWGSGLLWQRGNMLTLLTVAHNFKGGPKRLDSRFPGSNGTLLIEIPEPGWDRDPRHEPGHGRIH
jgi:hypothetical protein